MRIQTVGNDGKPVIVMLTGSFCQSVSLAYLYERLKNDYGHLICSVKETDKYIGLLQSIICGTMSD